MTSIIRSVDELEELPVGSQMSWRGPDHWGTGQPGQERVAVYRRAEDGWRLVSDTAPHSNAAHRQALQEFTAPSYMFLDDIHWERLFLEEKET